MIDRERFYETLCGGDVDEAKKLVEEALSGNASPASILNDGLIAAMGRIGVRFRDGEVFIPEVLLAARAMHAGMAVLKPLLAASTDTRTDTVLLGTVKGDLHDIGKNLVIMMLEGAGFNVVDLGIDVPHERFVQAIETYNPAVLGLSALLTTTMAEMRNTIAFIDKRGIRERLKIIVGGAPVTEKFARDIGADGYGADATSAVDIVKKLVT